MDTTTSHAIKKRVKPNDVFITPLDLVKIQIDMIDHKEGDKRFDPFYGTGNYYNSFPTPYKEFCEIAEPYQKDFFTCDEKVDVICSNPPYSMIDKVLHKSVSLSPRIISYLIGQGNLTARRIEIMNNYGYGLSKLHMTKVFKWYGMSYIVQFEKGKGNCISFDRSVHRLDED